MEKVDDYTERNFLDEIYEVARKADARERYQVVEHIFYFESDNERHRLRRAVLGNPPHLLDAEDLLMTKIGGKIRSPRMKAYTAFADRFNHIGILKMPVIQPVDEIVVSFIPNEFISFYNRRFDVHKAADTVDNLLIFTLSKSGIFARKDPLPKDKECRLEEGSNRCRLMFALVRHHHTSKYIHTKDLHEELDISEIRVRKAVSELRGRYQACFSDIKNTEIIDSKQGSGYRINPETIIVDVP